MKFRLLIFVLLLGVLSGCFSMTALTEIPPTATVMSASASDYPVRMTPTLIPSPQIVPSIVPAASQPRVSPPISVLRSQRLSILPKLPSEAKPRGELIFTGKSTYVLNFDRQTERKLPGPNLLLGVSPDGKWVAYQYESDNPRREWLIVENAEGQQASKIPFSDTWIAFGNSGSWLDNQHLVFNILKDKAIRPGTYHVVVINPFTGEQQELPSNYPGLKDTVGGLPFLYSTVVYHPSLNLVVYPETKDDYAIVLWDRQTQKALATIKDLFEFGHPPVWSPDGLQFAIAVASQLDRQGIWVDEIFSVSQSGKARQLTYFGRFFESIKVKQSSWSPDGRYLAFWLITEKPNICEGNNLAVLEVETLQVTAYCMTGYRRGYFPPPLWSLDGQYLAILGSTDSSNRHTLIVDINQNWAARIAEDVEPAGWLIAKP